MKMRFLLALVGVAIGFALPSFAQEKNTVAPRVYQQIEAVFTQFQEAFNKHDAAAMAALYTQDAVEVRSWQGMATGREAIQKRFADDFASNPGKMVNKLVLLYPIGSDICVISDSRVGGSMGSMVDVVTIYVPQGDGWKIRMAYAHG
jgi:ketosteroid isomerase-like protein